VLGTKGENPGPGSVLLMQLNAFLAFIIAAAQLRVVSAGLIRRRLRLGSINVATRYVDAHLEVKPGNQNNLEVKPGNQNKPWSLAPYLNGEKKLSLVDAEGYPPKAPAYAWWAATYGELAPTEVCDFCGGWPGHTKWIEVSPTCAKWVVKLLRIAMVCNNSNRFQGFGDCLKRGDIEKPDCSWCSEPDGVAANITDYCKKICEKWEDCKCTTGEKKKPFKSSDDWMNCVGGCAFNCKPALQLELDLGFSVSWRDRKCAPLFFACGGENHGTCIKMKSCPGPFDQDCVEKTCAPPLGSGSIKCYHDDPYCGGREIFPNVTNETNGGMADMCVFQRGEGELCREDGFIPMWKKAKGAPPCEEGLVCNEDTHKCEPPPPPEPEVDEAQMPGPGPGPAPAPGPEKPTIPPHPQWDEIKEKVLGGPAPSPA